MRVWIVLAMLCGVARADLSPPIAVKSALASDGSKDSWKVVATGDGTWCQAKVSPTATYTITLAEPTAIASVVVTADKSVTSAEIVVDGKPFTGAAVDGTATVKLGGGPASKLVVSLTGTGHACVSRIGLGARIVYGAGASTLWSDAAAIKAAVAACDKNQLAAAFAFPFSVSWPTTDNDGLKYLSTKYTTVDKLKGGCQRVHLKESVAGMSLVAPDVTSTSPTELDRHEDGVVWHLVFGRGRWRAKSVLDGG